MSKKTNVSIKELESFIKKYISKATIRSTLYGVFDNDKFEIWVNPEVETACTYFDHESKKHIIFVGNDFSKYINTDFETDKENLITSLILHESGHVLYTEQDLDKINKALDAIEVPFSLFNLAEDARIEHKIREHIRDYRNTDFLFRFDRWMELPRVNVNMNPEAILYYILTTESRKPIHALHAPRVEDYYRRMIDAPDSMTVVKILKEWKEEFHTPKHSQNIGQDSQNSLSDAMKDLLEQVAGGGSSLPSGDDYMDMDEGGSEPSMEGMDGQDEDGGKIGCSLDTKSTSDLIKPVDGNGNEISLDEMKEMSVQATDNPNLSCRESDVPYRVNTQHETNTVKETSNTNDIFNYAKNGEKEFFQESANQVAKYLEEIKDTTKQKKVSTRKARRKLNSKSLFGVTTNPNSKFFKKKKEKPVKLDNKQITFVFDLSGSMSGTPIKSQRTLALAANKLVTLFPHVGVHLIGSKDESSRKYQTVKLPANEQDLISMTAGGGSRVIKHAMEKNKKMLQKQDVIVFVTDGGVPNDLNKEKVKKMVGEKPLTLAVYVEESGSDIFNDVISKWFDATIISTNIVDTVKEMVEIINDPQKAKNKQKQEEDLYIAPSLGR